MPDLIENIGVMAKAKSKTRQRTHYGSIRQRETKIGLIRRYWDYRDEIGKRVQKLARYAQTLKGAELALETEVRRVFAKNHRIKEQKKIAFDDLSTSCLENYA